MLCSIIRKLFRSLSNLPVWLLCWLGAAKMLWFGLTARMHSVWEICGALTGCATWRFCKSLHEDTHRMVMGYEKEWARGLELESLKTGLCLYVCNENICVLPFWLSNIFSYILCYADWSGINFHEWFNWISIWVSKAPDTFAGALYVSLFWFNEWALRLIYWGKLNYSGNCSRFIVFFRIETKQLIN